MAASRMTGSAADANHPLQMLKLDNQWHAQQHAFARWCPASRELLRRVKVELWKQLQPVLSRRCAHVKGHGGAKGAVRRVQRLADRYPFVARFDIRSYYESLDHRVLLTGLREAGTQSSLVEVVRQYLTLPDNHRSGRGMVAGGAISPLLGALYLTPLDQAMQALECRKGIRYQRFMDDFVIFAPTRHTLRAAIRETHRVLEALKLTVHPEKRFIGPTRKGVDFLGYRFHPQRKLRPARVSLQRLFERARRLQEQGADSDRLRQYVERWYAWLHGGLRGRVSRYGRFRRIWITTLRHLHPDHRPNAPP